VSFGGTIKLSKGSSSIGPCLVCMGTGRSNFSSICGNVCSYLQIASVPFRFMIPIHWVRDEVLIDSDIALLIFLNAVYFSIGHCPALLNLVSPAGPRP